MSFQQAFSLTVQVMNTVTVPQGDQYGTDSGSGEGNADHSCWGLVRDHQEPALYWYVPPIWFNDYRSSTAPCF